ncbi:polysaccharide deacetylase family protein, partial [Streptomyces sp. YC419]|nr:polysaccharide deacetylase family protein [Streptomyces ureilyticus]
MRSVRQDGKAGFRRALATAVLTSALLAAGATGCARPVDPAERPDRLDRLDKKATSTARAHSLPAATYRRWGLAAPLAPAPEPPARPA